jgi:hypothetical protein
MESTAAASDRNRLQHGRVWTEQSSLMIDAQQGAESKRIHDVILL